MRKIKRGISVLLVLALCLVLTACGARRHKSVSFKVIAELNQEEFTVAFRKDDPLCTIMTSAMKELSADGQFSRLSSQYLGADYTCMPSLPEAMLLLEEEVTPGRHLRIGVQDGIAPLCSSRDDGSFSGMIPDLTEMVMEKLGWTYEYMVINSDNVAAELGSGNIDCAWMAASFAGEEKTCSLSPGWLQNTHELVVRADGSYSRKSSLKGKILGVTDSTGVDALKADGLMEKIGSVWYYTDLNSCFTALALGDCDALVVDSIVSGYYM